jgi:hypothetical protein
MLKYAMVTNGSPGRCFQQQDLDVNGVDANSGNGIPLVVLVLTCSAAKELVSREKRELQVT